MTNHFEEFEDQYSFTDEEIFTKIWTSPRKVFNFIHKTNHDKYLIILLFLSGVVRAFDRASLKNLGDTLSLWSIIAVCIIFGGLFGWITYYIYAGLVSWTGKWLDGKSTTKAILRILSYAMIPSVLSGIFLIPQLIIYENEIFKSDGDIWSADLVSNILFYGSLFFEFLLSIYSIALCVIGLSEVQSFSLGKAILNLLFPILIFIIPILVISILITNF
ncbi:MAG TPA: Yip1 family protein [Saprospiraceae bacterium]|nr:Yip1 family protein [Saprospiraceae bacterium]HMU03786.1 Yip1 family protein [Saprospiraceae bacterium]